jgi:hypothetical protein
VLALVIFTGTTFGFATEEAKRHDPEQPEEHIAFKAEMQTLRHIVRKVRSMRLK